MKLVLKTSDFKVTVKVKVDNEGEEELYCSNGNFLLDTQYQYGTHNVSINILEKDEVDVLNISKVQDNKLLIGKLIFKYKEEGVYFEEVYEYVFENCDGFVKTFHNKAECEVSEVNKEFIEKLVNDYNLSRNNPVDNKSNLLNFTHQVMLARDPNIYKFLIEEKVLQQSRYGYRKSDPKTIENLLSLILMMDLYVFENLIKSGLKNLITDFLEGSIESDQLTKGSTTSDILGIPQFAINCLKNNDLAGGDLLKIFNRINAIVGADGLKIFIEMVDAIKAVFVDTSITNIFGLILECLEYSDYKPSKLRDFVIRNSFTFALTPCSLLTTLRDYLKMCSDMGVAFEKYPQNIKHYHDRLVDRYKLFKQESKNKELTASINEYKDLLKFVPKFKTKSTKNKEVIEKEVFIMKTPESVVDLVREGENLHHCVGSYTDRIIKGNSLIFFLRRRANPDQSLVTVELNKNYDLIQARARNNSSPSREAHQFIKDWLKNIKSNTLPDQEMIKVEVKEENVA